MGNWCWCHETVHMHVKRKQVNQGLELERMEYVRVIVYGLGDVLLVPLGTPVPVRIFNCEGIFQF